LEAKKMNRVITFRAVALVVLTAACTIAVDHRLFSRTEIVAVAQAAAPQYKVVSIAAEANAQSIESLVNTTAAQGWELQTVITPLPGAGGVSHLIFRKRA
jgi:hypothetical protein